jgi:hypothetical protein
VSLSISSLSLSISNPRTRHISARANGSERLCPVLGGLVATIPSRPRPLDVDTRRRLGVEEAPLPQEALLDLAGHWAEIAGDPPRGRRTSPQRHSHELLRRNSSYEVWRVGWPQGARLELHDHGCSSGAILVTVGRLLEHFTERGTSALIAPPSAAGRAATPRFRSRIVDAGEGAAFDHHCVHEILNPAWPAASIHVYSPPLCPVRLYRASLSGLIVDRTDSVWARGS